MSAAPHEHAARLVTPIVLTFNEAMNLGRTLDTLGWAKTVLVVDSGSTDGTVALAAAYPNVTLVAHSFEGFGPQWSFALSHPAVSTPYVLALDADMAVGPGLMEELERRVLLPGRAGARIRFEYRVGGTPLWGSLYPADVRLFLRERTRAGQRGHAHRFDVDGPIEDVRARLIHDDRKPLARFVAGQMGYSLSEQARIMRGEDLRLRDRLRSWGIMAPVIFTLAYLRAGGPFRGRAALRYAYERALYESLLALRLLGDEPAPPAQSPAPPERSR